MPTAVPRPPRVAPAPAKASSTPRPGVDAVESMVEAAAAALARGERVPSERALDGCVHRDPPVVACELQLARLFETIPRRAQDYRATLERAVTSPDPDARAEDYDDLTKRLRRIGLRDAAVTAARAAVDREPTAPRLAALASLIQVTPDRQSEAIELWRRAVERAPERRDWRLELATLASRDTAHLPLALTQIEALLAATDNPEARTQLLERREAVRAALGATIDGPTLAPTPRPAAVR